MIYFYFRLDQQRKVVKFFLTQNKILQNMKKLMNVWRFMLFKINQIKQNRIKN